MKKIDSAKIVAHASIIFVLCLALYMYLTKDERAAKIAHDIEVLKDNCDFAIGTAIGTSTYSKGGIQGYVFDLKYKNIDYRPMQNPQINRILTPNFTGDDFVRGKQYLVLVDKSNPQMSLICFDKPINDSIDYRRYVDEFIKARKR